MDASTTHTRPGVGAGPVLRIANGYREAKILFAAHELRVFDILADGPLDGQDLADRAGLHPRAASEFIAALAGLGLLERDEDGRYRNSVAAEYLVADNPGNLTGFVGFLESGLHPAWDGLVSSLRTGAPATRPAGDGDPYRPMYGADAERGDFIAAMDALNAPAGRQIAALDWTGIRTVVDVGGARGSLSTILAEANPHLHATVFDLPDLAPEFARYAPTTPVADRVSFHPGDFFTDDIPDADAVVFAHVFHNWPLDVRTMLLGKAARALRPGGTVFVYDAMLDEGAPALGNLMLSLDMLVWSAGGAEYTPGECRQWLRDAGFGEAEQHTVGASSTVLVARKLG
ncbi:MAG TPA: methyltransferase [Pseudonocardiaceae bacterium]|nr:methyltransferase [Pseudonocardiaceae bacterium]